MSADEPGTARRLSPRTQRLLFSVACALALGVTVIFLVMGDGVEVSPVTGLRGFLVNVGHTGAWVLLTLAFGMAAWRSQWSKVSNALALAALVLYAAFLFAVFLG